MNVAWCQLAVINLPDPTQCHLGGYIAGVDTNCEFSLLHKRAHTLDGSQETGLLGCDQRSMFCRGLT
jgi:hypothetical protein